MATFKLNKTAKSKKFEYTVTNENGEIVSSRISARDYVACTADGIYYFGRLDLIGKGEHGRMIKYYQSYNYEEMYKSHYEWHRITRYVGCSSYEDFKKEAEIRVAKHLDALNSIAYL